LILVDTSMWIELFAGRVPRIPPAGFARLATCGPIIQEVMQGLRPGADTPEFRESFLALPRLCDPMQLGVFLSAADLYRHGRQRGYTLRSPVDCLIAAVAIQNRVPVWHRDRDFDVISRFTNLQTVSRFPGVSAQ
jgi:predicted nucleic acid-binding protein